MIKELTLWFCIWVMAELTGYYIHDHYLRPSYENGSLICMIGGERVLELHSKRIRYLGGSEWEIQTPNGSLSTFVKGQMDSCFIGTYAKEQGPTIKQAPDPSPEGVHDI